LLFFASVSCHYLTDVRLDKHFKAISQENGVTGLAIIASFARLKIKKW